MRARLIINWRAVFGNICRGHAKSSPLRATPCLNEVLRFNSERMSDAGDIVEISHDLSGIMDGAVTKAVCAQLVEVFRSHGVLPVSKVSSKLA